MVENEREAAVLSVCLLTAALEDGNICAGLAPIVTAVGGLRNPLLSPEFIEEARQVLAAHSITSRQNKAADISKIKQPTKSKVPDSVDALLSAPEWAKCGETIKLAARESDEATKALVNQVLSVVTPLVEQVQELKEEVNMLWWYIGGWSRALEKPFADLEIGLAALMAGIDLAHLTQGENGPVAAPAILQRLVVDSRPKVNKKISLDSAINALPSGTYQQLLIPTGISNMGDICPVLSALAKSKEIGGGNTWHAAFKKVSGLEPTTQFSPLALAMQVYQESLLLAQID